MLIDATAFLPLPPADESATAHAMGCAGNVVTLDAALRAKRPTRVFDSNSLIERQLDVLHRLSKYHDLRDHVAAVHAKVAKQHADVMEQCAQALSGLDAARDVRAAALANLADVEGRIDELRLKLQLDLTEHDAAVQAARSALEKAVAEGATFSEQMAASERMWRGIEERDAAVSNHRQGALGPGDLLMVELRRLEAKASEAVVRATEHAQEAQEELRHLRAELALIEYDAAINAAICAHLRATQAIRQCERRSWPWRFEEAEFYTSCGERALKRSNIISGMGDRGPVVLGGLARADMVQAVCLPELALLDAAAPATAPTNPAAAPTSTPCTSTTC
ncbi:hypothetical protein ACFPPF_06640 [Xenophilus aerolatus]|nr:hypothetical protein [Xenophilus aerolatus]